MKNSEIAAVLYSIADILEMQNVQFKPNAYRKAARSMETSAQDAADIYAESGIRGLHEIPGIGEHIAAKIEELLKTGKLKYYDELKKNLPPHISKLMEVPGMGPKRIKVLHDKLKVSDVASLEKAAKAGKISSLAGFGKKSENEILKGVELLTKGNERLPLWDAMIIAEDLKSRLKSVKGVIQIEIAGSLRRRKETIGDIDILVTSKNPARIFDYFAKMPEIERVLAKGSTKSSVLLKSGLQVDLRIVDNEIFGAALQYFTGSKEHNVAMRQIAIKKGLKLSEYGMFTVKGNKCIAGKTEEDVYHAIGMAIPEPELRENTGEIAAAISGKFPKLISYNALKGDFHMHTKKTDGNATIQEMAVAAKQKGYEYIAITDHSKSTRIAHGLGEEAMLAHLRDVRKIKVSGIRIFAGAEVDILPSGEMDYADDVLKKMDIVVASVHSRFKSSKEEMTKRITAALQNRHVDILGHPTGRLINRREPYDVDIKKVIQTAAENNVYLEINSQPGRMDLKDTYVKQAKEMGAKFVIDTDSHSVAGQQFSELGIAIARRGWLEEKDVINTHSLKDLPKFFRKLKI